MLVLNKKRIYIVFAFLILSTLVFQIGVNSKKIDVKETVALPVNNKVIIIDAGHGRWRPEVLPQMTGIAEADINLKIAWKKLQKHLT